MKKLLFFLLIPTLAFGMDSRIQSVVDPTKHYTDEYHNNANLSAAPAGNITWYVDGTNGNDNWNGQNATHQGNSSVGPFKTIGKALDRYAGRQYGQRVLIRAGTYKERNWGPANLGGTGSDTNRFMIGAYGDGEVKIDASETVTWTSYAGTTYQANCSGYTVDSVIMDDNFRSGWPKSDLANVSGDGKWWQNSTTGFLYLNSTVDTPANRTTLVRRYDPNNTIYGIYITDTSYITIYGLTILSASSIGITFYNNNNGTVQNCKIKYSGKNAIVGTTDTKIIKNYAYANCMMNWPRGSKWGSTGGWPTGINPSNGGNATGNIIGETGGEGLNVYGGGGGGKPVYFLDNIVYNSYSVNIYPDSKANVSIFRNFVYSDADCQNTSYVTDNIPGGSSQTTILRKMRAEGIMLGDETAAGGGSKNQQIINNVIIGCREGINAYHQAAGSGWINDTVYGNTIVMPNIDPTSIADNFYGIDIGSNGNNLGSAVKNNLLIGTDSHGILFNRGTDGNVTIDNNTYYHFNNATALIYNSVRYNFTNWQTASSQDGNSSYGNQNLTRADWTNQNNVNITDFNLTATSNLVFGKAINLSTIFTTDYNSYPRTEWSIGAMENNTTSTSLPPPTTPDAPILTSAIAGNTNVTLSWQSSNNATGYNVKRGIATGNYNNVTDVGNVLTTIASSLTNGVAYYFVVEAYNGGGISALSNERNATPTTPSVQYYPVGLSGGATVSGGVTIQ